MSSSAQVMPTFCVICRRVDVTYPAESWGTWGPGWARVASSTTRGVYEAYNICRGLEERFDPRSYNFSVLVVEYDVWDD